MTEVYTCTALSSDVLVVMTVTKFNGKIMDCACYIGAVQGKNHDAEAKKIAEEGSKLSFKIAKAIFPNIKESEYRF